MPGHRSSSSTSRLIEGDEKFSQSPTWLGSETSIWEKPAASAACPEENHERSKPGQIPICLFILSFVCFFVVIIALALALGPGCAARIRMAFAPAAAFNYSSYYAIPEHLDMVPISQLINNTELELRTDFVVTKEPTLHEYTFNVTQVLAAPDGFQKPMILVNGQSPGPLIEASIGDTIRVHLNNMMADASTTIHWHGINQHGSTWMDGVAGISQCGIPPGQNFTYEFVVEDQRGTFWWHAHLGTQYTDGLYGPIVIRDPAEMVPKTDEERILFVGDLYHTYGSVLLDSYLDPTSKWALSESGVEPLADNIVLNGQHRYNCSVTSSTFPPAANSPYAVNCSGGQLYHTRVRSGQKVRLRLINSSSFLSYWFSIDNHTLTIVELDGVEVEPIAGERGVYLNIGQRVSVVLTADRPPGSYYVRATLPQTCFLPYAPYVSTGLESVGYEARGVLSYYDGVDEGEGAVDEQDPIGVRGNVSNPYGVENNGVRGDVWEGCDDMPFDMPKPMRKMDAVEVGEGNYQYIEYMFRQAQDVNRIFINKTAYSPLENNATIWKVTDQKNFDATSNGGSYHSWDFGLNQQILLIPDADKGAQIVINSKDNMEHPWHMHGHTFQIVGWGPGAYGTTPNGTRWNLSNPMRRDTVTVPAQSHVVLRFAADNPGLWALHCHVAWHMEGGMLVTVAERPTDLVDMLHAMDPGVQGRSIGFCGGASREAAAVEGDGGVDQA